jgi:hypothetical protein
MAVCCTGWLISQRISSNWDKPMKIQLDFDTPNDAPPAPTIERRITPRPPPKARPVCPFCFQSGIHRSAVQCLHALERVTH